MIRIEDIVPTFTQTWTANMRNTLTISVLTAFLPVSALADDARALEVIAACNKALADGQDAAVMASELVGMTNLTIDTKERLNGIRCLTKQLGQNYFFNLDTNGFISQTDDAAKNKASTANAPLSPTDDIVISTGEAPIEVVHFATAYFGVNGSRGIPEINYSVRLKNTSDQDVAAVGVGLMAFSAFNELIGSGSTGVSMETIKAGETTQILTWSQSQINGAFFEKYGTGVVFLRSVRMADGAIWRADLAQILGGLQKIEGAVSLDDLGARLGDTGP